MYTLREVERTGDEDSLIVCFSPVDFETGFITSDQATDSGVE